MQRVTAVPYYTTGAYLGLVLGYVLICIQIIQVVPGIGWLANALRALLPEPSTSSSSRLHEYSSNSSSRYPKPDVAAEEQSLSGSFAVMDAGSLGSALYQMERPGGSSSSNNSSFPNTPHPSFQDHEPPQRAAATAAASAFRGTAAIRSTLSSGSRTPASGTAAAAAAAQEAAAADGTEIDQQQLLIALRDKLNSFPLDNLSPTTTATAMSLLSALAPAGNSEYGADDEPCGYALGPVEPVEGELDIRTTHSTSSNLMQPATPTTPTGDEDAAAAAGVPVLSLPAKKFPVGTSGSGRNFTPAGGSSPIVRWGSGAAAQQQQQAGSDSPATSGSGRGKSDTVPLTDRAVEELNKQINAADAEAYRRAIGSPRSSYVVGLPAQRTLTTQNASRSSSVSGSSCSSPSRRIDRAAGSGAFSPGSSSPVKPLPAAGVITQMRRVPSGGGQLSAAAAAGGQHATAPGVAAVIAALNRAGSNGGGAGPHADPAGVPGSAMHSSMAGRPAAAGSSRMGPSAATAAAAAAPSLAAAAAQRTAAAALDAPRSLAPPLPAAASAASAALGSPRSGASMSSIRTTDSVGTVDRKKQKGLLAALKTKVGKGRQQVR